MVVFDRFPETKRTCGLERLVNLGTGLHLRFVPWDHDFPGVQRTETIAAPPACRRSSLGRGPTATAPAPPAENSLQCPGAPGFS